MSKISSSARLLKKWSTFLLGIRPKQKFSAYPEPTPPDYSKLDSWLAHPDKESKALMLPQGEAASQVKEVPTFFIHPTTYFSSDNWNADINDIGSRKSIEEMVLPAQASVLNHLGDIYVPIYRQATFYSFMMYCDDAHLSLELAYQDVVLAFEHFIKNIGDKPFFIVGHSQGTLLGMRLLADKVEQNEALRKRLVAAYMPGYKFPLQKFDTEFKFLKKGEKPDQVHCILCWDTFTDGFHVLQHLDNASTWIKKGDSGQWRRRLHYTPFCINPVTWDVDQVYAPISAHKGAVINEYNRKASKWIDTTAAGDNGMITMRLSEPKKDLISAKVGLGNLLYISKPAGRIFNIGKMPGGNYHVYDFTLFYMDIRSNASLRWAKYKSLYLDNELSTSNTKI